MSVGRDRLEQAGLDFRWLIEQIPAIAYAGTTDAESLIYISPQAERMLGYTQEEWFDDPGLWLKALHPDDRERVLVEAARARDAAEPFEADYRMLHRDGRTIWIHDEAVSEQEGDRQLWQGVMVDITERKRAEEAIKESEERFRITFESAAVGMAHLALDGRWLRINDRLLEIVGYEREELLTLTFQDITHPEDLDKDLHYTGLMRSGKITTYSTEKRYLKKDGSRAWVNFAATAVSGPSGDPEYFIFVVEDTTKRRQSERISEPLKPSEMQVLRLVAQGRSNPQIARTLRYSQSMIKLHVSNILAKFKVKNRTEAAREAIEFGLVPPPR